MYIALLAVNIVTKQLYKHLDVDLYGVKESWDTHRVAFMITAEQLQFHF